MPDVAARSRYKKTVFDNGLTLVTEQHSQCRGLSIGAWVKAGTRHERRREAGVSHFLEHMLFKGTETRSALDIARAIDEVGGEFNAFTAREYTCFHVLVLERDVALGVEILNDVILNSAFDPGETERERKVILQEIAMIEETPEDLAHDVFFELAYGTHGLGRPILGTETSIRRMRRGDLLRYFRKHYLPSQTVIAVSGDVSHESVRRRLKPLLKGKWPGRPRGRGTRRELGFERAPHIREGTWWVVRPTEQVHLVWGVEGPKYTSKDRYGAFLLDAYLGGGMSSALFQEIREKNGLAYTVYSNLSPFQDSGVFSIYAATGMKQVAVCLRLLEETLARLRKELLSPDDLERVKENLKGTFLLSSDNVESRMTSLAKNEIFHGQYIGADDVCRRIDEIRSEDLRRVARKWLGHGRRGLLLLGPKPGRSLATRLRPSLPRRYCRT